MKPLPEDPFAFQARVMSALCDDILDLGARRDGTFPRMAALREVSIQTTREPAQPNKRAGSNK